jgi:hypothetical protein
MENCPRCQVYYESGMAMARGLSASAGVERREPPAFLHGKIMSAIRSEGNVRSQPAAARLGWTMAVGTVCVVVIGIVSLRQPAATHPIALKPTPVPAQQVVNASVPASAQIEGWVKTSEAPLENETELVVNDAKTAMNSLVKSLVPDNLLASSVKNGAH